MSPSLEDCPNEIFESIIELLHLHDICNLRLCNRILATKTTQGHFKSYFRSKHVDITESSLQKLVNATKPSHLGCLIQHLVLVGIVNNSRLLRSIINAKYSSEEERNHNTKETKVQRDLQILEQRNEDYELLHESGTDVKLLSEAFKNIVANNKTRKLLSLSLEVAVYREDAEQRHLPLDGGNWNYIWKSAIDTFDVTIQSLTESSLPIEKFNIFNNRQLQRCSIAYNKIDNVYFTHKGLGVSLASLNSLSISISDRGIFHLKRKAENSHEPAHLNEQTDSRIGIEERDTEDFRIEQKNDADFVGLAKLLQLCSQLKDLEIHFYRFKKDIFEQRHEKLLQYMAELKVPPQLNRLELRGLYLREQELLAFIQRTRTRRLFMHHICMFSGTFRSVFDYCASEAAGMEELYFKELLEWTEPVFFDGPGKPNPWVLTPGPSCETLERVGSAEVQKQIISRVAPTNGPLSSARMMVLRRESVGEYGPPNSGLTLTSRYWL